MNIQIISKKENLNISKSNITTSTLDRPMSLDSFDYNIIDISGEEIWKGESNNPYCIDDINNFRSIADMVRNSEKTKIIYVLPRNHKVYYSKSMGAEYYGNYIMKNDIHEVCEKIINEILPSNLYFALIFEPTVTDISEQNYYADFFLKSWDGIHKGILSKSTGSGKVTTMYLEDTEERICVTTLDITETEEKLINFINVLMDTNEKEEAPDWIVEVEFGSDNEKKEIISKKKEEIDKAQNEIREAEIELKENLKYKSILYTNGDELVEVVFEMLEKIFSVDLSGFDDEKKEDFLFEVDDTIFIGEIKGVNENTKNKHVSQVENHYQTYISDNEGTEEAKNIKQLLIINPLRKTDIKDREPIHKDVIKLAKRNGCLIVETKTLLSIFEKVQAGEDIDKIQSLLTNETGLLDLECRIEKRCAK